MNNNSFTQFSIPIHGMIPLTKPSSDDNNDINHALYDLGLTLQKEYLKSHPVYTPSNKNHKRKNNR